MKGSQVEKARPRLVLAFFISTAVFLLVTLFSLAGFLVSSHLMSQSGQEILSRAAEGALERIVNHLSPAVRLAQMNAQYLRGQPRLSWEQSLEHFNQITFAQMRAYPQLALLYYGREDGYFFMNVRDRDLRLNTQVIVRKNDSSAARARLAGLQEMKLETPLDKAVFENQLFPILETRWWFRDAALKVIRRETVKDYLYDPRLRPWYRGAVDTGGIHWTEAYVFPPSGRLAGEGKPGITVSYPVVESGRLEGVVGVDIDLEGIANILGGLNLGPESRAFVINSQGQPLALQGETEPSKDPLFQNSYASWLSETAGHPGVPYRFTSSGKAYLGVFSALPEGYGLDWLVGVAAPEEGFWGSLGESLGWSLAGAFVVWILVFWISLGLLPSSSRSRKGTAAPEPSAPAENRRREISVLCYSLEGRWGPHRDLLNQAISESGGVAEIQGEAVTAVWRAPASASGRPLAAVRAAVKIQRLLHKLKKEIEGQAFPSKVPMGLHTGEETSLGRVLSQARSLEALGGFYDVPILIDEETHGQIQNQAVTRKLDKAVLEGREEAALLYEVMGLLGEVPEKILRYCHDFDRAVDLYLSRQWNEALGFLDLCFAVRSKDKPSQILAQRCIQYLAESPPLDWKGEYVHGKS